MSEFTIKVEGMGCDHCKARVEQAAQSVESVQRAEVDLGAGILTVVGPEDADGPVRAAVREVGYEPD